jgi:hypothetical protein
MIVGLKTAPPGITPTKRPYYDRVKDPDDNLIFPTTISFLVLPSHQGQW